VLIVVSAYRPAIIADMHRARMLAWEMPKIGWDVEVLAPGAAEVRQDVVEPDPDPFFAPDTPVHEVGSFARGVFEMLGSRTHAWRTLWPIRSLGAELLRSKRFDLVYFTTTTFLYFSLGPYWRRKFGIPFVLDFHDPWVRETAVETSRGVRSKLLARVAERMERSAVTNAAGVVSVSPRYIGVLERRYCRYAPRWLAPRRHAVIPFGARCSDMEAAAVLGAAGRTGDPSVRVVRYVGAGGAIMARSFSLVCRALAGLQQRGVLPHRLLRIELFGTTYGWRPGDDRLMESIARSSGVGELVREHPERVSYRRSLELLLGADGALVLGVDDHGYMPSKLLSYALSGKPLLASLRRDGPAYEQMQSAPGLGHVIGFDPDGEASLGDAEQTVARFLGEVAERRLFDRRAILEPFLAPVMAERHAELFDACVHPER
jgi:hypothetical protein